MIGGMPLDGWTAVPCLKEPLATTVHALEEDIIFGRLKRGQRLVEDVLMERFSIKRHVARQALTVLEQLGLVMREPNKGARVRDFAPQEVEQIYDVRFLLNEHAARLVPLPTPRDVLDRVRAINDRHGEAVESGDLSRVYRLDNQFHDAIFSTCGNPYLLDTIKRYAGIAHAIRFYRLALPDSLRRSRVEHSQMIEALAAGDREVLVKLCVEHIKPSVAAYLATEKDADED